MPNIQGRLDKNGQWEDYFIEKSQENGALAAYLMTTKTMNQLAKENVHKGYGTGSIVFDASKSNSIYGLSSTVQPKSYTVLYIMKIKA